MFDERDQNREGFAVEAGIEELGDIVRGVKGFSRAFHRARWLCEGVVAVSYAVHWRELQQLYFGMWNAVKLGRLR